MPDIGVHRPFPLVNRQHVAHFQRGVYDGTATGDAQYRHGDIVTTRTGVVLREIEPTTAANIDNLSWAGQPWDMPKAFQYFKDRGVPLNRITEDDEWVFTLAGTLDAAAILAVNSGEEREVLFNTTSKCLTIRSGTTNPAVKMLRVFEGVEGDTNAWVACNILPGVIL